MVFLFFPFFSQVVFDFLTYVSFHKRSILFGYFLTKKSKIFRYYITLYFSKANHRTMNIITLIVQIFNHCVYWIWFLIYSISIMHNKLKYYLISLGKSWHKNMFKKYITKWKWVFDNRNVYWQISFANVIYFILTE